MKDILTLRIRLASFFHIDCFGKEYIPELKKEITANRPFSLNIENWEKNKELFKKQHFDKLQKGLTDIEKTNKEIKEINSLLSIIDNLNLPFNKKEDFHVLANRYVNYLKEADTETTNVLVPKLEVQRTKRIIKEYFESMDDKGFKYAFRSENDYNTFINILINHFEFKEYDLPENTIQLQAHCKTKLVETLGKIHLELSNVDVLKKDEPFFNIVKCLSPYNGLTKSELYKGLTRNR